LDLVREVEYAQAYSFKYSPRPGTPAATDNQVPEDEKADRLARLQALLRAQQAAFNVAQVGKTLPVLIEKPGRNPGQMVGRSPYLQPVHLDCAADLAGQIVDARIEAAVANSLSARMV
ncbi:MAG: TRAM domain-containing protein, partial [Paracoccaceae bacterium]